MIVAELFAKLGLVSDEGSFEHGHELVESLHHAVEAYLGFEGLNKIKEMVEGTVEAAVQAKHLGEQLNISSESVQELGYAADVTGASAETMNLGMRRLAMGLEQLHKTGSGPARDALVALKVHMSELKGENLEQNLEVIADHFAALPPEANKTALAMELFGRQGAQLIPLLNRGGAGVKQLREEAQRLGVVMSDEMVEKSEEFELSQKKLAATLTGLRNEAVEALLPTLQKMVESLTEWVSENREAIASTLETVMHAIAAAFEFVGEAISETTHFLMEHKEFAIDALEAIGAVLAAFAVNAAADWIIAFAPIIGIVAAITGIIALAKNWDEVMATMKDIAGDAWDYVKDKAEGFAEWFEELPERVADWVEGIADSIRNAFQSAWDYVVNGAHQAWEDIKDTPVIGHLIRAGGAVADFFGDGGSAPATAFNVPNFNFGGAGAGESTTTNHFGDVNVTVDASNNDLDEDAVGEIVGKKVREHQQDMVREAYQSVSGGRR